MLPGQFCSQHKTKALADKGFTCTMKKCNNEIMYGLYLEAPEHHHDDDTICYDTVNKFAFGWCHDHYDTGYRDYIKKRTRKLPQNSNKISLNTLCESMYRKLDSMPGLLQVDEVLIENQPTFLNPTMKSLSVILFSYFEMRGKVEKDKTRSLISSIKLCSPANKLTIGGNNTSQQIKNTEDNKVYKVTKELGRRFCKALVSDNMRWSKVLESHKKQDDMADAFLQVFMYYFGPVVPEHYAEKIRNVDTDIQQKQEKEQEHQTDENIIIKIGHSTKKSTRKTTFKNDIKKVIKNTN
jgi:hypothetical protein